VTRALEAAWSEGRVAGCEPDGDLYHLLTAELEGAPPALPGQFYLLAPGRREDAPADPLLLRPMSALGTEPGHMRCLFKVCGRGTRALAELAARAPLRVLGPLGRPFTIAAEPAPLLVGGGVGIPPLHFLSRTLSAAGIGHRVVFGFGAAGEVPAGLLAELDAPVEICTLDGSAGFHGNPLELLATEPGRPPARVQACGPPGLLDALKNTCGNNEDLLELSLEERMACGVGVCRGCVLPVRDDDGGWHYATVCREGPVFAAESLCDGERGEREEARA